MERQTLGDLGRVLMEAVKTGRQIEEHYLYEGGWKPVEDCIFDLDDNIYRVQPEPRKPREVYRNYYEKGPGQFCFDSQKAADDGACDYRTECVHFREVLPEEE